MNTVVRDNPELSRYEIHVDDRLAGFGEYELSRDRIALTHTEVGEEFSGRGLARTLVAAALAESGRRGLAVLPFCPYVGKVIAEEPDRYLDLVPDQERVRFGLPAETGHGTSGAREDER